MRRVEPRHRLIGEEKWRLLGQRQAISTAPARRLRARWPGGRAARRIHGAKRGLDGGAVRCRCALR